MSRKYVTKEMRSFIIKHFAGFEKPKVVCELVHAEFGVEVTRSNVYKIKATHQDSIFRERKRLADQLQDIPIANLFYRLKERQKMVDDIKEKGLWYKDKDGIKKGNHAIINKILDSCSEEFKQAININVDAEIHQVLNLSDSDFMKFLVKEKDGNLLIGQGRDQGQEELENDDNA